METDKAVTKETPLFKAIPKLKEKIPHIALTEGPTPVFKLEKLGAYLGIEKLYCKDEGATGTLYGGNKPRKLEFLFGDAISKGAKRVITFGAVGSNHAVATAAYAKKLGLAATALLVPQPKTESCHKNLLYHSVLGTELIMVTAETREAKTQELIKLYEEKEGVAPYVIPTGGTNEIGILGFVNAGIELSYQIEAGDMPPPDVIYIASGTSGTISGITIGLKIMKQKATLKPIRVSDPAFWTQARTDDFIKQTASILEKQAGISIDIQETDCRIIDDYYGKGYGVETPEIREVLDTVAKLEGLNLEIVYTTKPMAALFDDAKKGELAGKVVLYWKTNNSIDLKPMIEKGDKSLLPQEFQEYV